MFRLKKGYKTPTGYTDNIKDGISFKAFVLQCARAFGACVEQRDDDKTVPPKKQKPSNHYKNKLKKCNTELTKIKNLSKEQLEIIAKKEFNKETNSNLRRIKEMEDLKIKYESMLELVNLWCPPTQEHTELKTFMVSQIESSIDFDCDPSFHENKMKNTILLTGKEWKQRKIADINKDIQYYQMEHEKEIDRFNKRNKWIDDLYKSFSELQERPHDNRK